MVKILRISNRERPAASKISTAGATPIQSVRAGLSACGKPLMFSSPLELASLEGAVWGGSKPRA